MSFTKYVTLTHSPEKKFKYYQEKMLSDQQAAAKFNKKHYFVIN